jgi:predicted aspartyl protease
MRIDGEWFQCLDGDTRPVVRAEILLDNGTWLEIVLLVDTGADRTVLSAHIVQAFNLLPSAGNRTIGGVGGIVEATILTTQIRLRRDDGSQVTFRGQFAALTAPDSLDMSVLGRDVLDRFTLIVDRAAELVVMLAGHHTYSIHRSA